MSCIFCHHIESQHILYQSSHFKLVFDIDPIQTGHLLLISSKHHDSITDLSNKEKVALITLQSQLVALLEAHLPIGGVTVAYNDKDLKDQGTHFHLHLIPRKKSDGFWENITLPKEDWDLQELLKAIG